MWIVPVVLMFYPQVSLLEYSKKEQKCYCFSDK